MRKAWPTLPNLVVIGAAKCGTTSLHSYLGAHPEIFMSAVKEVNFFFGPRWELGLDWYRQHFDSRFKISGETSPVYSRLPRTAPVAERMSKVVPDAKLIYMVRDPIDRLLSLYVEIRSQLREEREFPQLLPNIEEHPEQLIQDGRYFYQLKPFLKAFGQDRVKVLVLEELKEYPEETLSSVFTFLGVDKAYWCEEYSKRHNVSQQKRDRNAVARAFVPAGMLRSLAEGKRWPYNAFPYRLAQRFVGLAFVGGRPIEKPALSKRTESRLKRFFCEDVEHLCNLLGRAIPSWRNYGERKA